jgi:hypothetical protein
MKYSLRYVLVAAVALCCSRQAVAVTLEQVISHENPLFRPDIARLTVGRDGLV